MTDPRSPMLFAGHPIEEMSRESLIIVIETMAAEHADLRLRMLDWHQTFKRLSTDLQRLKKVIKFEILSVVIAFLIGATLAGSWSFFYCTT